MDSSKSLGELAASVGGKILGTDQVVITDVTHDSRQAGPGTLFVAIEGASLDGHAFVGAAVDSGTTAICVTRKQPVTVPQLIVSDTRGLLGQLAAEVHGWPSRDLDVIGVTGTNGKTTVTHYIESLLTSIGVRTGLIGTITTRIAGEAQSSVRTTPEASDLQRLLRRMADRKVEKVAAEVSSHALDLGRVVGTTFSVAAFTNLSQDHLDFHGTMDAYRKAKESLFTHYEVGTAVVNVDDSYGANLAATLDGPVLSVGKGGDYQFVDLSHHRSGTEFTLIWSEGSERVFAPLHGEFNVFNLVMAIACCSASGSVVEGLLPHIRELGVVPGRFEMMAPVDDLPDVVVDYAHTPEGIRQAIDTARSIAVGNVIAVLGAGGDRDRSKRLLMGEAASAADLVVVTSDNPRTEDPESIVSQIAAGVTAPLLRDVDRRRAIFESLELAGPDDLVLILGKGHEQGQEVGSTVFPFDDLTVAGEALIRLRKSTNSGPDSGSIRL